MTYHNAPVPCDDCGKKVCDIKLYGYVDHWYRGANNPVKFPIYLCLKCVERRGSEERILQFPGEFPL